MKPMRWRIYQALFAMCKQAKTDCIFAVNEASSLPVLVLKRLGLLRTPVLVFCTGLMHPRNRSGLRKRMWRWLLPCAEGVISQTSMEKESTWKEFELREDRQFLIPMLVDTNFFKPEQEIKQENYCLAVGTNQGRDYPTLLKAFPKNEKLVVATDGYNAAIIEKNAEPEMQLEVLQAIPIRRLKELYQQAKVIINPLAETSYCSGHTVLLENMALGKTVIISDVGGMRDYIRDGVNVIAVKPNDVDDLRNKLLAFLSDPQRFAHIGQSAVEWAQNFSCDEFARKLISTVKTVIESGRARNNTPVVSDVAG